MSDLLDAKIRDGLDLDRLRNEISNVVNQAYTHVPQLIAVTSQADFKGLTPLQVTGRAIAEQTEIPWENLLNKFSVLSSELKIANNFVKEVSNDVFAGIKYGGISQETRNLLYFCVRVLIVLEREESLRPYAGFGGENSQLSVPMKVTLDALIEKFKDQQVKLASETNIDEVDFTSAEDHTSQLKGLIAFAKGQRRGPDDKDDNGDDDNDDHPGPSGATRRGGMDVEHSDVDEPDQPNPPHDDGLSMVSESSGTKRSHLGTPHEGPRSKKSTVSGETQGMFPPMRKGEGGIEYLVCKP
jgi:hypothetical protein